MVMGVVGVGAGNVEDRLSASFRVDQYSVLLDREIESTFPVVDGIL
jgi:hypothetical protein